MPGMHESPRPGEAGYCQVLETAGQPSLLVIQVARQKQINGINKITSLVDKQETLAQEIERASESQYICL